MRKLAVLALASGASLAFCVPAQAAVTVGGYTIEEGTFGAGTGVHSTGTQKNVNSITGIVNKDGSGVTFTSSDLLSITGKGEAVISPNDGSMTDLGVLFANAWDRITFSFDSGANGTFGLVVNGTNFGTCSICNIGASGQNKFIVSGAGITSLAFTFNPAVSTARQFRVEEVAGAVPEPATWAMMLIGFGAVGFGMRRRRDETKGQLRVRFAS
jgi:hypothetical protein